MAEVRTPTTKRAYRKLETASQLKTLMRRYYAVTKIGPRLGLKSVWLTSGAPVEIPLSMGIIPVYPENYGALCGARRVGVDLCARAEAKGYSPDLCSYARTDLGSLFAPHLAPLGGLPRPDVLVACNNICGTVTKWWEHLAYYLGVPFFLLDTPFAEEDRPAHLVEYAARQVGQLIEFLERHTRRSFKERKFRRVAARSAETVRVWNECLELCAARPAPLGCADRFLAMAPVVTLRGTRPALRYYRALRREVAARVEAGVGAVVGERRRLLWDNIAIWYEIYGLFNRFAEAGVAFPVDTYTSAWTGTISEEDPAWGVARVYSGIYLNQGIPPRLRLMARMLERFECDGFVLHCNRSCKPYSLGQLVIKQELTRLTGKPGLLLEADMVDARHYDGSRVAAQVAAFLEVLS
jgi:benzoyl-CoA reductase/2-hydroxyglutaryl-CoA dehydratase subunit BcrC/BadD/HgdB